MTRSESVEWLRVEHLKLAEFSDRLREETAVVPRANLGTWIRTVAGRFDHYRAHLLQHMALEEKDGYLACVVEQRPSMKVEVDRLKHEHTELMRIMDGIHRDLHSISDKDQLLVRECSRRINEMLDYVEHHERDEDLLLTFVFTHDIGTKD